MLKPLVCITAALVGFYLVLVGWWPIGAIMIIAGAEYSAPDKRKGSSND